MFNKRKIEKNIPQQTHLIINSLKIFNNNINLRERFKEIGKWIKEHKYRLSMFFYLELSL